MHFSHPTIITCIIAACGVIVATPALAQGFSRRGTGVKYEKSFLIQRAPQLASMISVCLIVIAFLCANNIITGPGGLKHIWTLAQGEPHGLCAFAAWLGTVLLGSGMIFMIGGWYSLGDCFSTDAEVLDGHTVRNTGLLKYVMHPAYSGIIQSLLGAALAADSPIAFMFVAFVVAPLWLQRAKYEEAILMETLGQSYAEYGNSLNWRRLVPSIFPIGV